MFSSLDEQWLLAQAPCIILSSLFPKTIRSTRHCLANDFELDLILDTPVIRHMRRKCETIIPDFEKASSSYSWSSWRGGLCSKTDGDEKEDKWKNSDGIRKIQTVIAPCIPQRISFLGRELSKSRLKAQVQRPLSSSFLFLGLCRTLSRCNNILLTAEIHC